MAAAQLRTEEGLQRQGAQFQVLIEAQQQLGERVQALTAAQERTEGVLYRTQEELRELANWQRSEVGRRDGEWGG